MDDFSDSISIISSKERLCEMMRRTVKIPPRRANLSTTRKILAYLSYFTYTVFWSKSFIVTWWFTQ